MSFSAITYLEIVGLAAAGIMAATVRPTDPPKARRLTLFGRFAEWVDHKIGWDKLPRFLGVAILAGLRNTLRRENLYDTTSAPSLPQSKLVPDGDRFRAARAPDGTFNDLTNPAMGAVGARFGRNFPIEYGYPEPEPEILTPNPRIVSQELLTRHTFAPATTLNLLAGAWLQFMIHDWFSHGKSPKENPWKLPLAQNDSWHENPMIVLRTRPDETRPPDSTDIPPTYTSATSAWWDGSQVYGASKDIQDKLRSGVNGKLKIAPNGLIPINPEALAQPGAWLGLAVLTNLFSLEHNAICDHLHAEYPTLSDDELFDKAQLVNSALLAKIHTVEWTPGILGHPTLQIGMRANWWGLAGEWAYRHFGRLSRSEIISGIVGGDTNHFGVPYSLTEEFVAVYRMHPLIPDDYVFRAAANGAVLEERGFRQIAGPRVEDALEKIPMGDILYSFGTAHPGAIQLHNYPRFLQTYERPDGFMMDLAATDILRSRELGVPRYNLFRQLLHKPALRSIDELTDNPTWREELKRVYDNDIDRVDVTVGLYAERPPKGFGFSDTAFRIFVLMASRRLNSDRFFTVDYTPKVYTAAGLKWLDDTNMKTVLLRHYPQLEPALGKIKNAFAPWMGTP